MKAIVGAGNVVTYGADWTEYGAHVVDGDAAEVRFPLDPLWASSAIDVVGIDYYPPLADWRDDAGHLDQAIARVDLRPRLSCRAISRGGEGYDWYYADDAARAAQTRTPITDGLGKPWMFRAEGSLELVVDMRIIERVGGMRTRHADRLGAAEQADLVHRGRLSGRRQGRQPAERVSRSEIVRKRAAVFFQRRARRPDPAPLSRSVLARSIRPSGAHDDDNPVSTVYGGRMLDRRRCICGPGTRGPIRCFPPRRMSGATGRIGRPGTGSPAGSAARRSMRWSVRCSPMPASAGSIRRRSARTCDGYVDRPADVAARHDRAAGDGLCVRRDRERRRAAVRAARRRAGRRDR